MRPRGHGLGTFTGGVVHNFGAVSGYAGAVCAKLGCGTGPDAGSVNTAVQVGAPQPATISDTVVLNTSLPTNAIRNGITSFVISGALGGDVVSLGGSKLYVILEDPSALFESSASVTVLQGDPWRYQLRLTPRKLTTPGRFTGTLRAFACLDARCAVRLGGTPLLIPYDVIVTPGLTLASRSVNLKVPFGTQPDDVIIATQRGPLVREVSSVSFDYDPWNFEGIVNATLIDAAGAASSTGDRLRLRFAPREAGLYRSGRIVVTATVKFADGSVRGDRQTIDVRYEVDSSSASHVAFPNALSYQLRVGQSSDFTRVRWVVNGGFAEFVGFEYLSRPAELAWDGSPDNWLVNDGVSDMNVSARTCYPDWGQGPVPTPGNRCLIPGNYRAQARVRLRTDPPKEVLYPITLTVLP